VVFAIIGAFLDPDSIRARASHDHLREGHASPARTVPLGQAVPASTAQRTQSAHCPADAGAIEAAEGTPTYATPAAS
jgi:hypothetical protein